MNNDDRKWHGVRYLVHDDKTNIFEERTIILKADSSNEALDKGELNAREYCEGLNLKYCYIEEFSLVDDVIEEFTEVYSVMRETSDSPMEYIKKYMKTGDEINMHDTDIINTAYEIIRPRLHANFELPTRQDLLKLEPGDSVKLMFKVGNENIERMWVTLADTSLEDIWIGTIDNDSTQELTANILPADKEISFHPLDIIATY